MGKKKWLKQSKNTGANLQPEATIEESKQNSEPSQKATKENILWGVKRKKEDVE